MTDNNDDNGPASPPNRGQAHSSPYPVSRLGARVELVDLAKEIDRADEAVATRVSAKLEVIAEQVRALQKQARKVLADAQQDSRLHHARCAFKRVPGKLYHLYLKSNGQLEFSMISPEDWGGEPPNTYQGSYRLELDMSWTPLDKLGATDNSRELVSRLLGTSPLLDSPATAPGVDDQS